MGKTVYISFIGDRDPYNSRNDANSDYGAGISVFEALKGLKEEGGQEASFTDIVLIYTPDATPPEKSIYDTYTDQLELFEIWIKENTNNIPVHSIPLKCEPHVTQSVFENIIKDPFLNSLRENGNEIYLNVSSGTPAMRIAITLLAATRWFVPASFTAWQGIDPKHKDLPSNNGINKLEYKDYQYFLSDTPLYTDVIQCFNELKRFDFISAKNSIRHTQALIFSDKIKILRSIINSCAALERRDFSDANSEIKNINLDYLNEIKNVMQKLDPKSKYHKDEMVLEAWSKVDRFVFLKDVLNSVIWLQIFIEIAGRNFLYNKAKIKIRGSTEDMMKEIRKYSPSFADVIDFEANEDYKTLNTLRNKVVHEGGAADQNILNVVQKVAKMVLDAYFDKSLTPRNYPLSSESLISLFNKLEKWFY